MTLTYKMQLSEGFWDKILHSEDTAFFKGRNIFSGVLSLKATYQSSGNSFCDFFVKITKESEQPFGTTPYTTLKSQNNRSVWAMFV